MVMMAAADGQGIKIGELVKRTGVTRATVHHYVKEGLLPEPVKTSRNMALYHPECVDRVLLIKGLQEHSRRSLAEVKTLLQGAPEHKGVLRLQNQLEVEASRLRNSPLNPDRSSDLLSVSALAKRTSFTVEDIEEFHALGLITGKMRRGKPVFGPTDIAVADALAALADVGFDKEHGFKAQQAVIYLEAMRDLLHREVSIFLGQDRPADDPEELLALAEQGIERVTSLMLTLRRKLIREFIDAGPLMLADNEDD